MTNLVDSQGQKEVADDAENTPSEQKDHSKDGDEGANPAVATLKGGKQNGAKARQPASVSAKQQETKSNQQITAKIGETTPYESNFEGEPPHRSLLAYTDVKHRNTWWNRIFFPAYMELFVKVRMDRACPQL